MAINLPITSTFDDSGLNKAQKALAGLGKPAAKLGNILKASVVPGLVAAAGSVLVFTKGLNPAIQAASDLGENTSKIEVIFGDAGRAVTDFAKTAARDIGQSQNQVLAAAGTFGTFGKAAGLAGDQLATFTTDFITLSADLASFNNATPDEAINAIGAALRGEAEPLRRFGVLLNDATLKAAAMELGIYSGSGALTAQQKILAAQKVIYEQTGDAQGDFTRTSDGLANQQRILSAQLENVKIKIGEALLPAFTKLVKFVNDFVVPALDKFISSLTGGKGVSESMAQAIAAFGPFGPSIVGGMRQAVGAMLQFVRTAAITYESIKAVTTAAKFFKGNVVGALKDFALVVGAAGIAQATRKLEQDSNEFFDGLLNRVEGITSAVANQNKAITDAESRYEGWGKKIAGVTTGLEGLGDDDDETTLSGAAKKVTEAVKKASEALNKEMGDALDAAKDRLKKAQDAFNEFSKSVSDVIKGALDFGAAFEEGGEDAGSTFFSALQKQADKAKEFASLVEQLLASGLSQEALQQVIDAGIDSGSAIAKELLQSSENVLRANKLVEETNKIAEQIGILSANKFYAAGVSNAQQYLAGVEAAMAVAQARLGKKGINLADVKGISSGFNNAISTTPTMTAPTMPSVIPVGAPTDKGQPLGNVTINVASQLATKAEVGEAVNDALRAYNRLSGPLQLQIA
jgi:hypothetical protein